eukprot:Skav216986  [mRNA]  locus=scaffold594:209667:212663:- [translate_table: standard]
MSARKSLEKSRGALARQTDPWGTVGSLGGVSKGGAVLELAVVTFPMNIRELDLTTDTLDGGTELINEELQGGGRPVALVVPRDLHSITMARTIRASTIRSTERGSTGGWEMLGAVWSQKRPMRTEIVSMAKSYRHGDKLPRVRYTEQETKTWQAVYERLQALHEKWACREYSALDFLHFREMLPQMEKYCGNLAGWADRTTQTCLLAMHVRQRLVSIDKQQTYGERMVDSG